MRFLFHLFLALTTSTQSVAQGSDKAPPPAAVAHFTKNHPNATKVRWELGRKNFRAEFRIKDENHRAVYTPEGEWVRTEHDIPRSELPAAVKAAISTSAYRTWDIDDVEQHVTTEHPNLYKISLENDLKKADLHYTPEGKMVREQVKPK